MEDDPRSRQVSLTVKPNLFIWIWYKIFRVPSSTLLIGRSRRPDQPIYCAMTEEIKPGMKTVRMFWSQTLTIERARMVAIDLNHMADQMEIAHKQ